MLKFNNVIKIYILNNTIKINYSYNFNYTISQILYIKIMSITHSLYTLILVRMYLDVELLFGMIHVYHMFSYMYAPLQLSANYHPLPKLVNLSLLLATASTLGPSVSSSIYLI